ncbi:LAMI_0F15786g1_1 [Lachancea mirantina]|uniref:LAMI_0F15786g1_1 n=1 Tax=Lachancea mirantina TaxID=1230905 RepID=A0A1G4K4I2_9SACH|nr:LAMI_0F15786g1_1 [Lachancea mirantina]
MQYSGFYNYAPNTGAAAFFSAVFGISMFTLAWIVLEKRKKMGEVVLPEKLEQERIGQQPRMNTSTRTAFKYFFLVFGCGIETGGYIARAYSSKNTDMLVPYVIHLVFLLVSPALMAASIYMIFGRMLIIMQCTSISLVPVRFNTAVFVTGDVVSFLLQAAGGGMMATESSRSTGEDIIIGGLLVQIVFFGLFIVTEVLFSALVRKRSAIVHELSKGWHIMNLTLIAASICILIRSIVRVVEFFEGFDGYLMSNEWTIYVFDALPMFMVPILFIATSRYGNLFQLELECARVSAATGGYPLLDESIDEAL